MGIEPYKLALCAEINDVGAVDAVGCEGSHGFFACWAGNVFRDRGRTCVSPEVPHYVLWNMAAKKRDGGSSSVAVRTGPVDAGVESALVHLDLTSGAGEFHGFEPSVVVCRFLLYGGLRRRVKGLLGSEEVGGLVVVSELEPVVVDDGDSKKGFGVDLGYV